LKLLSNILEKIENALIEKQAIENERITKLNLIEKTKQESIEKLSNKYKYSDKARSAFNITAIIVLILFLLIIILSDFFNFICFSVDRCKKSKKNKVNNYKLKKSKKSNHDEKSFEHSDRVNNRLELFELVLYESILDRKLKQAQYRESV
jgi:hypothetical protein